MGAVLYTLAAPPYDFNKLGWIALAPLFIALRGKSALHGFAIGFIYGLLICTGVAHWLHSAIAAYFGAAGPLTLLLTLLAYSIYVGIYTGAAAAGICLLAPERKHPLFWLGAPALWVAAEFARSSLFSGFSWELLGHTQYRDLGLIQIADLAGVYGVSFLLALTAYIAAQAFTAAASSFRRSDGWPRMPWPALICLVAAIALVRLYGSLRISSYRRQPADASLRVALVHALVPQQSRWQRARYAANLAGYLRATQAGVEPSGADLIVWPEFAVGFYLDREFALRAQLAKLARSLNSAVLVGAPRMDEAPGGVRYYNSAYFMNPDGQLEDTYDKVRLLPFAEYEPVGLVNAFSRRDDEPDRFSAGGRTAPFALGRAKLGVLICYESTYPELARRSVRAGAEVLVNISNDGWLVRGGNSAAMQHFSMAVFRAVENRRALAASATYGYSGFVDPVGGIHQLSTRPDGVILGTVQVRHELTIYSRWGDWFAWCCALAGLVLLLVRIGPTRWRWSDDR